MKIWKVTSFNYDADGEETVKFFKRQREAFEEYEHWVPDDKHASGNTRLLVDKVDVVFKDVLSLVNRHFGTIENVKDWETDPRRAELEKEEDE